jgi:UPF0755 protein
MKQKFLLGVSLLAVAILIAALLFVNAAWLSRQGTVVPVSFSVSSGDTLHTVADRLVLRGIIGSSFGYRLYGLFDPSAKHPKTGDYQIRPGSSYRSIARLLAIGPQREEVSVTLIEGKTIDDEATQLLSYGVKPVEFFGLVGKTKNAQPFSPSLVDAYPILKSLPTGASLEGYLFPDTYRVWKDELPESLVKKQLNEFQDSVVVAYDKERIASGMTWNQVVTLASIVEKEVKGDADRHIVAGIFLRRMKNGMRLQSDATVSYGLNAGQSLATAKDVTVNLPYNTYLRDGLPAGPIDNPSLSSIRAVLEPKDMLYYYFLTDKNGAVLYAKTFEEHKRNIQKAL